MAKRFTDTEKWNDGWFTNLSNDYKIIWLYLLDNCDYAGIIKINIKNINFFCSSNISVEDLLLVFEGRITKLNKDTYLINKFCVFQYGNNFINSKQPPVIKAINKLVEVGIIDISKGSPTLLLPLPNPSPTLPPTLEEEEEDKDEVKEKVEEEVKEKVEEEVKDQKRIKIMKIMQPLIDDGTVELDYVKNLKLSESRELLTDIFFDYPNWEQDLYRMDYNTFIQYVHTIKKIPVDYVLDATLRTHLEL